MWSTPVAVPSSLGLGLVLGLVLGLGLIGCGSSMGTTDWARFTARTCASTLARAGYDAPIPAVVDPARFLAERQRMLADRKGFNTVTPFRQVCSDIRAELDPPDPTLPAP